MGHKVNPDIFRLGITKTWSYQLRTNKNFLKNLFLFRLLKNLFLNYNIPLFTWKKHRNIKINDKLTLKGEEQISKSPLVSTNVLFSHVFFGLLNDSIHIESYFIEAGLKQRLRKPLNPPNEFESKSREAQPWQSNYYKKNYFFNFLVKKKKDYLDLVPRNKLKSLFDSRRFRKLSKKNKIFVVKPVQTLNQHFYFFSKNYNAKYSPKLDKYFTARFKQRYKKTLIKKRKTKRKNNNKKKVLRPLTLREYKKHHDFYTQYYKRATRSLNLFFNVKKLKRSELRFETRSSLRYLRKKKYYRLKVLPNYKQRNKLSHLINLARIKHLAKKRAHVVAMTYLKKKSLPKTPLSSFNIIIKQRFFFYKIYKNIVTLKYFIRALKYLRFFGIKKRVFFCHNLISLLFNFMGVIKKTMMAKKLFIIIKTIIYYSYSLSFYNFVNMKKKYMSKFMLYKAVSKTLFRSVLEITNCKKVIFSVTSQNKYRFNSSLVLNYILIKLGQYFNINEIVNPLSFFIKHLTCIAGYKILIRGRLTRKERAAVMIRSGKKMPLSTVTANVDYSQGSKIMKFGMVGIKVYLMLKPSSIINLYRFSYKYAKIS